MVFKRDSQELDDVTPKKSPEQTFENVSEEVDPDAFDRSQLARLGKKSVLRVRLNQPLLLFITSPLLVEKLEPYITLSSNRHR
jgi:hypothetical protein